MGHADLVPPSKARYNSINGLISSAWVKRGDRLSLAVEVPPNTTAMIRVPSQAMSSIFEGDAPAEKATGVSLIRREKDAAFYQVGSGRYVFRTW